MTLKDFFTLNELENGLTTRDRVNELITVMQSEKDSTLCNFGQTTRLWSTVANTIAATENKDCLDLFIQLDGLFFLDKWLKDAQKLENNNENDFFDELIISLLRALERLQIDSQRLSTSEIGKTVQDLVAHSSSTVCVKVKELCDSWKLNIAPKEVENLDHVECRQPDIIMDSEPKDQELLDHVDPSCKSADDNDRDSNSKSEGVRTLSSTLEQIASSADVDNPLESSVKTDTSGDKDDDMADDGESPKISSNSDNDNENVGVQINEKSEDGSHFFKLSTDSNTSDMKLDYGMIDPLDIARQVAIEVEQDVDSRERSCSTSEKTQDGEIEKPTTSDFRNFQEIQSQSQIQPVDGSDKEVLPEPMKDAETLVSQISEVAQVSEPDTGRGFGFSGFDLNQEVCSEEVDNPVNPVSSTISVVSASRAAAVAQVPTAPLQFEGAIGWKGCASTSAFRAVPVLEGSRTGTRTHNNSQQLLGFHDFDLNVAEDGDEDKTVMIPSLPSGEESSVANPKRPERVQLDLNSIGDDQNGWQSPYHASSSSSSSKPPIVRNIDLNLNDQAVLPNGEDSVVSIFGAKLEVKRKDYVPQLEPKLDFNLGRLLESSSMHYGHTNPSFYGHHQNGMFFSLPLYGSSSSTSTSHAMPMPMPMPYVVDSRGTPFAPQIIGSQPPPPFIMNMAVAGAPSGSSGVGPSQHNYDMNVGLMVNGGLRQFFPHNGNEQASARSVLGKRHEPDSNWELFPHHQQPPWR